MSDNKQLQNALEIATMAHKNVIRRNGDPYIFHVLRVANNALFVRTKTQKVAAILHDTIEDTPFDAKFLKEKGISEEVLDIFRVNLVESIEVPTLNVGDTVIINDVPACEKTASNGIWVGRMRYRMGKTFTVDKFLNHDEYGPLVKLDDLWFRTYHLEKINDFDIV